MVLLGLPGCHRVLHTEALCEQGYAGGSSLWMGDTGIGQGLGTGYHLTGGWRGMACNVSIKEAVSQEGRYC